MAVIPAFDHNSVIPPHLGNPINRADISPYPCTSLELCNRFATSNERVSILNNFLTFRNRLTASGLTQGFQWLDGSFLEDKEKLLGQPPKDMDLLTIFFGYDSQFQINLAASFPEFRDTNLSKQNYQLDHYPIDASFRPDVTVEYIRYWIQLFTHNRSGVWKGMLRIELNTPAEDNQALLYLQNVQLP